MGKTEVNMTYFDSFYPFSFSENNIAKGVFVEYLEYVFQSSNKFKIKSYSFPWERAQDFVRKGEYDGHITLVNNKREKFLIHNKTPIFTDYLLLIYSKNNKNKDSIQKVKTKNDMKKFIINDYIGNSLLDLYYPAKEGFNIEFSANLETCFKKLLNGRGDIILADKSIIDMLMGQKKIKDIAFIDASFIVPKNEYFLQIRKSAPYANEFIEEYENLSVMPANKIKFDKIYKYYVNNISKYEKYKK